MGPAVYRVKVRGNEIKEVHYCVKDVGEKIFQMKGWVISLSRVCT